MGVEVTELPTKKKMCGGGDKPMLIIHRGHMGSQTFNRIYSTEPVDNSTSPTYTLPWIRSQMLCNGDPDAIIRFEVANRKKQDDLDSYGIIDTTINCILLNQLEYPIQSMSGSNVGDAKLTFKDPQFRVRHTFG
jgi:hypothetical protein